MVGSCHFSAEANTHAAAEAVIIPELDQGTWNRTEIIRLGPGIAEGCSGLDEQTARQLGRL